MFQEERVSEARISLVCPHFQMDSSMTHGWCGIRVPVNWLLSVGLGVLCTGLSSALADQSDIVVAPTDDLSVALERVAEGGRIVLKPGIHRPRGGLHVVRAGVSLVGEEGAELHAPADLTGDALLIVEANGVRIQGLVFDGEFVASRAIRSTVDTRDLKIEKCEVRYWAKHGIDLDGTDQLVSQCHIHHCLSLTDGKRDDAHGVVTVHAQHLRIEGCRISNCSGDSVQTDRGRWQDVEIVDCDMFLEPLAESMGGFAEGDLVGENAFDSKREARLPRGRVLIENCRMWGFDRFSEKGNWAALNLKENVEVTVRGCTVERSQVGVRFAAVRLGGTLISHVEDCKISKCMTAFRFEDFQEGPNAMTPELSVENCQVQDCQLHVVFFNYRGPPGNGPWQPPNGAQIRHCLFDPKLRLGLGTFDQKILRNARLALLNRGENREQETSTNRTTPNDRSTQDDPQGTPTGSRTTVADPGSADAPVCPNDDSHRGRVYRRAGGQLHCRCPNCGALWKLADPTAPQQKTSQDAKDARGSKPPATLSKPPANGGGKPNPVPK
jgi:hypothetical protein